MEKFRKFIWILCFAALILNGAALIIPNVSQSERQMGAVFAMINGIYCFMTFDSIWGKKEDEDEGR